MKIVKIWLDDIRPAPDKTYWTLKSVNQAKLVIRAAEGLEDVRIELNLDHDLGEYAKDGGDAIKLLDWMVETERFYPVRLHTANPVGRENMQRMIRRYWPTEDEIF